MHPTATATGITPFRVSASYPSLKKST